jgi:hypothetical protein
MMGSKHMPEAPKLGIKGAANATFNFAGRTLDFSSVPAAPQAGTISLEGPKKLQEVSVASKPAKNGPGRGEGGGGDGKEGGYGCRWE